MIHSLIGQIQRISPLLTSQKVEETSEFYLKINQILSKINLGEITSTPHNYVKMVFNSLLTPSTGFAFFTKNCPPEDLFIDPNGRPIRLCSDLCEGLEHSLDLLWGPVVILRSSCIETTKTYYEQFHKCVEEQHGKGPKHYSISWDNGPVTEIYPKRKNCLGNIEFLFQSKNIELTARKIDEQGFPLVSRTERAITLLDPDGRFVNILSF